MALHSEGDCDLDGALRGRHRRDVPPPGRPFAEISPGLVRHASLGMSYVREWLGAMTTGRIVDHDQRAMTFLPRRLRTSGYSRRA